MRRTVLNGTRLPSSGSHSGLGTNKRLSTTAHVRTYKTDHLSTRFLVVQFDSRPLLKSSTWLLCLPIRAYVPTRCRSEQMATPITGNSNTLAPVKRHSHTSMFLPVFQKVLYSHLHPRILTQTIYSSLKP